MGISKFEEDNYIAFEERNAHKEMKKEPQMKKRSAKMECFDLLKMVVEEADAQFGTLWTIEEERLAILKDYCDGLDLVVDENPIHTFSAEVDPISGEITLVVGGTFLDARPRILGALLLRAARYRIDADEQNDVWVALVFPSLWERAV